ncbi:TPA-induced transmembrane protein isoform X1 [Neoarius graeffei]|uniref:TPA-induced transmembrane protein isoform X1 n=1 Tax=Neoarius graeffei TaxID=443677 RepID=UPI00298CA650|nr:TPA-induced transmembrane protein isoform X1 [Neoarius graeffei]
MAMELQDLTPTPDTNNQEDEARVEVCPGNGTCSNHSSPNSTEDSHLLPGTRAESNGAHSTVRIPDDPDEPEGTLGRLKRELNEPACWKLKVWMLILIVFIVLVLVIFLSLYLCSVYKEDVDDKYNVAEFVVPRYFRGNLTLLKNVTLDAQSQSSLQQKLTHIYTSSFALGRYFSLARVKPKRNSNSSAEYELEFKIPKEHEQLIRYTLSKELVYSVLLQQLFDQDTGDPLYIEPSSLTMEVGS